MNLKQRPDCFGCHALKLSDDLTKATCLWEYPIDVETCGRCPNNHPVPGEPCPKPRNREAFLKAAHAVVGNSPPSFTKTLWAAVRTGDTVLLAWPMPKGWHGHRIIEVTLENVQTEKADNGHRTVKVYDFEFEGQRHRRHSVDVTFDVYVAIQEVKPS